MTIKLKFDPPIPDGMRIMENYTEVAGVQHRMGNVLAFARRSQHRLELEREPRNRHDPNAIKVIGISRGWFFWRRDFLGYVPAEIAAQIAKEAKWDVIVARLRGVWAGGYHKDVVYIRFDILEPKPAKEPTAKRKKKREG